jgi:hypothetical protein
MATLARLKLSLARRLHKNLRVVQGRGAVGELKVKRQTEITNNGALLGRKMAEL